MTSFAAEIAQLLEKNSVECVRSLAEKYSFDPIEAMASLQGSSAGKPVQVAKTSKKAQAAEKKAVREAKKAAKAAKPKRAQTGYQVFCTTERKIVKAEGASLSPQDTMKELARRWKEVLSPEDRAEWKEQAVAASSPLPESPPESDSDDDEELTVLEDNNH